MTPDDAQRIGRLETAVAKIEQRVDDLRDDVKELAPLSNAVAKMEGAVERLQTDLRAFDGRLTAGISGLEDGLQGLRELLADDKKVVAEREQEEKDRRASERKDARRSRVALIVGCGAAILAPIGTIVAAVIAG